MKHVEVYLGTEAREEGDVIKYADRALEIALSVGFDGRYAVSDLRACDFQFRSVEDPLAFRIMDILNEKDDYCAKTVDV